MHSKEFILAEIRRCAEEHGGIPLGKGRFREATGISEADWSGRYWTRWSDAVAEAGFQPNTLNSALPEDVVLRHLALLVRELGHFPTNPELRLRSQRRDGFPASNTFRRFGGKQGQIQRVTDFCAANPELADVYDICLQLAVSTDAVNEPTGASTRITGSVYLAKSGTSYKIGRTNDTGRPMNEIRIQLPERLILVHSIDTDDPVGIEQYWHRRIARSTASEGLPAD